MNARLLERLPGGLLYCRHDLLTIGQLTSVGGPFRRAFVALDGGLLSSPDTIVEIGALARMRSCLR